MRVTQQLISDTVSTLNEAFSNEAIPEEHTVCNDCVDLIKESLADTIEAYEELYQAVRKNQIQLNMLEFLSSVRRIRNTNHCLRIHRDQFVAEAGKYYDRLKITYTVDIAPVIGQEVLLKNDESKEALFEALTALQRTAAAFGVCQKPPTHY